MGGPRIRQARYRSRARDLFLSERRYTKLSTSTKGADRLSTREALEYSFYGWILKRCSCCVTIKLLSPKGIWVLENWPRCVHISLDESTRDLIREFNAAVAIASVSGDTAPNLTAFKASHEN